MIQHLIFANVGVQSPGLQYDRISLEQGLSQSNVLCILQDKKGFMWFGTEDGLNRYDGYTFKIYRNNPADIKSYGRYPDGGDTWMELTPTPGGTNIPLSTENEISVPDRFTLSAYPNPFNSRVTIQFSLPRDVKSVTMDIFNLNGQRVWRQYLSAVSAGYHRLTWNGRDRNDQTLSSGLYFVRIRTEKYQTTRKIVMLK